MSDDMIQQTFFKKYKVMNKIGEGSFGKIYSAGNILTGEKYALKMESRKNDHKLLESEAYLLAYMQGRRNII